MPFTFLPAHRSRPTHWACDFQEVNLGQLGGCGLGLTKVSNIELKVQAFWSFVPESAS
jgi:hypothetical protein